MVIANAGISIEAPSFLFPYNIYIPYTKKPCSITNSWVKVTKKDNDYNYIVYLECGAIKSTVDHKGPQITLKGKMEETIEVNEDYKDPGVAKVYDKSDGNLDVANVKIDNISKNCVYNK